MIGIRDQQLSEALQLDADLTLEKAIAKCRQKEAVRRQQAELQNIASPQKIERIKGQKKYLPENSRKSSESNTRNKTCWFDHVIQETTVQPRRTSVTVVRKKDTTLQCATRKIRKRRQNQNCRNREATPKSKKSVMITHFLVQLYQKRLPTTFWPPIK